MNVLGTAWQLRVRLCPDRTDSECLLPESCSSPQPDRRHASIECRKAEIPLSKIISPWTPIYDGGVANAIRSYGARRGGRRREGAVHLVPKLHLGTQLIAKLCSAKTKSPRSCRPVLEGRAARLDAAGRRSLGIQRNRVAGARAFPSATWERGNKQWVMIVSRLGTSRSYDRGIAFRAAVLASRWVVR